MVNASKCISKFEKNPKNETKIEIINNDTLSSNKLTPGEVSIIKWMQYQTYLSRVWNCLFLSKRFEHS